MVSISATGKKPFFSGESRGLFVTGGRLRGNWRKRIRFDLSEKIAHIAFKLLGEYTVFMHEEDINNKEQ